MKVDNFVTFDDLSLGLVAKRNDLLIIYLTDIKSAKTGDNYFFAFIQSIDGLGKESVDSFLDCLFGKVDFFAYNVDERLFRHFIYFLGQACLPAGRTINNLADITTHLRWWQAGRGYTTSSTYGRQG